MARLEFRLPDVGEGTATADILAWHVAEGETVREHDVLVEVQTDKAAVDIPAPASGTVARHGAAEGESLAVGAVLAVIETAGGEAAPVAAAGDAPAEAGREEAPMAAAGDAPVGAAGAPADAVSARPLASPATRALARELGVDLRAVSGSGPHGRITREDVEAASTRSPPASGQTVPLRGLRRAIARSLTEAWRTVPHITDYREADATALLRLRDQGLAPTPVLIKLAATALARHPYVNASIDLEREEITLHANVDVGVATATAEGLVVPVVRDATNRSIDEIAGEVKRLTERAQANRLRSEDLAGGTFTVNNYGTLGIWLGTPIVVPPQVANLGIGAIRDQVVAVDGQPVVRSTVALAVSADHRVLDGHTLAAFVTDVVELMEQPTRLLGGLR
jgi:pyruvate/2-oxoglutarate dehydrogenase complex dihydrolipoamide acyltransferase (E2) component